MFGKFFEKLMGGKPNEQGKEPTEKEKREERLHKHLKKVGPDETTWAVESPEDRAQLFQDREDEGSEDTKKFIKQEEEKKKKEIEDLRKELEKIDLPPIEN